MPTIQHSRQSSSFIYHRSVVAAAVIVTLIFLTAFLTHFIDLKMRDRSGPTKGKICPGDWGDLMEWDIKIDQPDEYLSFGTIQSGAPLWNFGEITEPTLNQLLISSGLTAEQADKLLSKRISDSSGNIMIRPDEETLLSITAKVRSRLYAVLAANPSNRFQVNPFYVTDEDSKRLPAIHGTNNSDIEKLFAKLIYKRNGYNYFSDPEIVLGHIADASGRKEFIKKLTAQNSVLLKLRVGPDSDLSKITYYWSSTGTTHHKDIAPILEAEKQLPEGGIISALFLLPPLVREVLFTTPLSSVSTQGKLPDCHWTSLNFFADKPDARMSDEAFASKYISNHYYPIGIPSIIGDLALFVNVHNQVIHSAVYIADDVFFTKNGANISVPWVLMREKNILGSYSYSDPLKVLYFRKSEE